MRFLIQSLGRMGEAAPRISSYCLEDVARLCNFFWGGGQAKN
jgi:hypothetical protein